MRVLVCGSRSWKDAKRIDSVLGKLPRGTEVISGGARGADQMAAMIARGLGFQVREFPADWDQYGKSAGRRRNLQMLDENPELVIAFWDGQSTGTLHTMAEAKNRQIEVEVHLQE